MLILDKSYISNFRKKKKNEVKKRMLCSILL